MNILITGGTGFLGSALAKSLSEQGMQVTVLSRTPEIVTRRCGPLVHALNNLQQLTTDQHFEVVINLAGAPIFAAPWTTLRKKILRDSRIRLTEELVATLKTLAVKPKLLISGSAIGYYGEQGEQILTEASVPTADFSQQLCADWEAAALAAEELGIRVCIIRTGLVLGAGGGMLQRMLWPFKLGLGGQLGNGQQWMSWIHLQDWLSIVQCMMEDSSMRGAYNATAPQPVTNSEFTQTLAKLLQRPTLLPISAAWLHRVLGEMSVLVLGSQRVLPSRLQTQRFNFQYPDLHSALRQILKVKPKELPSIASLESVCIDEVRP